MRFLKKCTALFTAVAFAGASLLCVAPVSAVSDLEAQTAYNALLAVAENQFSDMSAQAVAVVSAQLALSYAYGWCDAASSVNPGNSKSYAGFCRDSNNNIYVGSGYINDSASVCRFRVSHDDTTITAQMALTNQAQLGSTRLYLGGLLGVSGGSGTSSFSLSTSSSSYRYYDYTCTYENDPISKGVCVGSASNLTNARFGQGSNVVYALFYDGGYNLSGAGYSTSGNFSDDLQELQTDLRETYPDVPENYFYTVDGDQDPTEETGGECGCTHIINIEPTINVEVNVEPTINVDVDLNVENPFPSEWLETIPAETVENPLEELPTIDVENFTDILQDPEDTFPETSGFWWKNFELWIKENGKLWKYFLGLFTIGVVGFILRKLG